MRDKRYRAYTPKFKQEALELLKNNGKSAGQLEWERETAPVMLLKWRDRYQVMEQEDSVLRHIDEDKRRFVLRKVSQDDPLCPLF